jgi:hypothetical protein
MRQGPVDIHYISPKIGLLLGSMISMSVPNSVVPVQVFSLPLVAPIALPTPHLPLLEAKSY